MGKVFPGLAGIAEVLANRTPLSRTQVGSPLPPCGNVVRLQASEFCYLRHFVSFVTAIITELRPTNATGFGATYTMRGKKTQSF
jgi:hypothetical protein